ncbi:TPX2 (targeting protein for Xklp2) protein family [Forsythia ovata]|uniref:TPX2 (Targeting protein for Xklp2) protein family n=1 Tax=Forsythia ovata TaxID=205694 RepID=A0ABD1QPF7_9LAMI
MYTTSMVHVRFLKNIVCLSIVVVVFGDLVSQIGSRKKKKIHSQMGRDVAGLRIDKKSNAVNENSNGTFHGVVHVAPKVVPERDETEDYEAEDHTEKGTPADESNEKQDVLGVKSINHEPEEKILKSEAHKSSDKNLSTPVKPASGSAVNGAVNMNSLESLTPVLESGKRTSFPNHANGVETLDSGLKYLSKTSDLHSPKTVKNSLTNSPIASSKTPQTDDKKYHDEDDNWSLASSTATSVRTCKSRLTVPVAPTFRCMERLERRKEFYTKLEEKHKALEQEKFEYEARTKEEAAAALKQLRKSMAYKANPVPNFYREGPPPKVELKKLPVTRAKSPNLTRRKSCSDAVKSSPVEKGTCARTTRHSVGIYKESKQSPTSTTPKSKNQVGVRNVNATSKVKGRPQQMKEMTENSHATDQGNADIGVES